MAHTRTGYEPGGRGFNRVETASSNRSRLLDAQIMIYYAGTVLPAAMHEAHEVWLYGSYVGALEDRPRAATFTDSVPVVDRQQ
jgi:hypothetical protein